MRTIWKFSIPPTDRQVISMPKGARILGVQVQHGLPCLWAIVTPGVENEDVEFRTHGTGHGLPADSGSYAFVGTYQLDGGALVFHLFRVMSLGEQLSQAFR